VTDFPRGYQRLTFAKAKKRGRSCLFCCYLMRLGTMLILSISPIRSWTVFIVAVEYFQEESKCMLNFKSPLKCVKSEGEEDVEEKRRSFAF
jgi:hypothetical protein